MADASLAQQCAEALPEWIVPLVGAAIAPHLSPLLTKIFSAPSAGSIWMLIRMPLELLAGNYGWAKNAGQETLPEWWATNRQALLAWLLQAADDEWLALLAARNPQTAAAAAPTNPPSPVLPPS